MFSKKYTKGLLEYRAELMGVGALGVLLTHSNGIVNWPSFFQPVVNYGGLGVYIFMFLSGIGMWFSLNSRSENVDIKSFYIRRWEKVFIPYLLIAGVWYCIKYIVIEHSIGSFLFELSTLSYWIEHKGAWYVAALVPIYLIYPFFYKWADMGGGIKEEH